MINTKSIKRAGSVTFDKIRNLLVSKAVVVFFVILCLLAIYFSKLPSEFFIRLLSTRLTRNLFLVLALIIPVVAGMGLNFSITIGAMAAQTSIIWMTHWGVGGFGGMAACFLMATPLAIFLGIIIGKLLNRTRGQEMIASMILGFFADGIYQLVFLFLTGKIIPMDDPKLILSTGVGVKNTIDLVGGLKYSIDGLFRLPLLYGVAILLLICSANQILEYYKKRKKTGNDTAFTGKKNIITGIVLAVLALSAVSGNSIFTKISKIDIPMFTVALIAGMYVFNGFILKTKIGQEFRAVGQNLNIAKAAGINVDRVRVLAIVLSTMFACWGQLIFLQNLGTINTYGSHTQVGFFAVGALVIGGASVTKANSRQAFIGVILLHTLFIAAPMAGKNLFGQPQIGEYFRVFVTYGVIGLSVALHAWTRQREKRLKMEI